MKRTKYPPLTPEELQALKAFAAYAGRTWKQELRYAWMDASMPGHLHSLRNSHGPAWLNQFQLPEEVFTVRSRQVKDSREMTYDVIHAKTGNHMVCFADRAEALEHAEKLNQKTKETK